jgi:hypothetical protein
MMRTRLLLGVAMVAGIGLLSGGYASSADEQGGLKGSVQKVADALASDNAAEASKLAADIAKSGEIEEVMNLMKRRDQAKDKKKVFGVGETPGESKPDGIEARVLNLKKTSKSQLDKDNAALITMAYRIAAIAEIAKAKPPEKDEGNKKKVDWLKWAGSMGDSAKELATAAKNKSLPEFKAAADKLNSACSNCHSTFRD